MIGHQPTDTETQEETRNTTIRKDFILAIGTLFVQIICDLRNEYVFLDLFTAHQLGYKLSCHVGPILYSSVFERL